MAKKIVKIKEHNVFTSEAYVFNFKQMALFIFMCFLFACGAAAIIQTILLQFSYGKLSIGITGFFIASLFIGLAKHFKWKMYSHAHQCCCK